MIGLLLYALASAASGAVVGYALAGGLSEGAIAGAVLGASIGVIIGMRRAGAAGPAFEYEAAGLHDDNLITTARRNLVRDAYRDSYNLREGDARDRARVYAAGGRVQERGGSGPGSRDTAK